MQKHTSHFTTLHALVPRAKPLLYWHFVSAKTGKVIHFRTILPITHEQLSVLLTPETNVFPYLVDFFHLFDFLHFLFDAILHQPEKSRKNNLKNDNMYILKKKSWRHDTLTNLTQRGCANLLTDISLRTLFYNIHAILNFHIIDWSEWFRYIYFSSLRLQSTCGLIENIYLGCPLVWPPNHFLRVHNVGLWRHQ